MAVPVQRDTGSAPPLPGLTAWVVSPHRLVAQAVVAALQAAGSPVEMHAWETLDDEVRAGGARAGPHHMVAIFDGLDSLDVVHDVSRLVALGGVRVAVVTSGPALRWGGLLEDTAVDVVTSSTNVTQLVEVVDRLLAGDRLMDAESRLALRVAWQDALDKRRHLMFAMRTLSPQQLRVLELLASGRQVASVAEVLGVAPGTVRSHVKSLRSKLGARTQLEAVAMLRRVHEVDDGVDVVPRPRVASADARELVRRR